MPAIRAMSPHSSRPILSFISRFLLELQEANQMVVRLDPDDPLHSSRNPYDSTPSFVSWKFYLRGSFGRVR
ncbi:hypothetical protein OH76DRAFT_1398374 [Lentinus brumalis]|uniref:Uncharacterized protein n=1 Tax=Lentinus brumalis TaxID=2498619 RepID=A0A371DNI5_9APHY|nr:hypothetical protein OH76DRAFT_1398374 [Polyporus brumalis]